MEVYGLSLSNGYLTSTEPLGVGKKLHLFDARVGEGFQSSHLLSHLPVRSY